MNTYVLFEGVFFVLFFVCFCPAFGLGVFSLSGIV